MWNLHKDGVTQGLLVKFLTCPEKLRWEFKEGLVAPGGETRTGSMYFGTIVHNVLEYVYTHSDQDSQQMAREKLLLLEEEDRKWARKNPGQIPPEDLETNYGMAALVLRGYLRTWKHYHGKKGIEWLDLEKEFELPYKVTREWVDSVMVPRRGKIDGVFREEGRVKILETKTKGQIDDTFIVSMMGLDIQTMFYLMSASELYGEEVRGVTYNVIRRPQLRRSGKETLRSFLQRVDQDISNRPEFYYMRFESEVSDSEMDRFREDLDSIIKQLVRWDRGEFHYRNSSACKGPWGRDCEYLPLCSGRGNPDLYGRKLVNFPELSEGGKTTGDNEQQGPSKPSKPTKMDTGSSPEGGVGSGGPVGGKLLARRVKKTVPSFSTPPDRPPTPPIPGKNQLDEKLSTRPFNKVRRTMS